MLNVDSKEEFGFRVYVWEWRKSVGIIIRKPNKLDYGLLNSYRVINLLDMVSKLVERIVTSRLEEWK